MVVKPHSVGFKNTSRYIVPENTTLTALWIIYMLAFTAPKAIKCIGLLAMQRQRTHCSQNTRTRLNCSTVCIYIYIYIRISNANLHKSSL